MRYIFLYITVAFSLYTESSYALETEAERHQKMAPTSKFQDPDPKEMMRRFKQMTPPEEFKKLQALARQILKKKEKQQEERITAAVSRIFEH